MERLKVLILSPGRQVELVTSFSRFFCVSLGDNSGLSLGSFFGIAQSYKMPPFHDASYKCHLMKILRSETYHLVLSLHDEELTLLASLRAEIEGTGCIPLCPTGEIAEQCLDKYQFYRFCLENDLQAPETHLLSGHIEELELPLIVKARQGMGSRDIFTISSTRELNALKAYLELRDTNTPDERRLEHFIVQEKIAGQEYGVDIVNDLRGNHFQTVIKRKIQMRGGETDIAELVKDEKLTEYSKQIAKALGHRGNADCDIIVSKGIPYIIDINPRFGGGYTFSAKSGLDVPWLLHEWIAGKTPTTCNCTTGEVYRRISALQKINL